MSAKPTSNDTTEEKTGISITANAPCHVSQLSMVAYDIEQKHFVFCNGSKWQLVPEDKTVAYAPEEKTKYKLIEREAPKSRSLPKSTASKNSQKIAQDFKYPSNNHDNFRCRASGPENSFKCKSYDNMQMAH